MPYLERDYKETNINYLSKDFSSLKSTLIEYAKTYFPNTYRDFNETSPGMMLIEMGAYVGDVLSFYIDQQYKEMMLPLAEERRNLINISNMLGYNVKPITPAYTNMKITQTVGITGDLENIKPDFSDTIVIAKGMKIKSTLSPSIFFETLDIVDFKISGSADVNPSPTDFDANQVVSQYTLERKVRAISGETKTTTFTVGSPTKFLKLELPETNVIEIIKVIDSNQNEWHEVDFLAQDKVPVETHYTNDNDRNDAYSDIDGNVLTFSVPYSLEYKKTGKRFITQIDDNNKISLIFGNGVLRNGQLAAAEFLQLDQVGIVIPGESEDIDISIDPLSGDSRSTLGETPSNTTLTVTYRIGGGITANVPYGDLTSIDFKDIIAGNPTGKNLTITNEIPARGGSSGESLEEIRRNAKAFFATQNRCVTKSDYEARILNLPAKFGNIAKVYVDRVGVDTLGSSISQILANMDLDANTTLNASDVTTLTDGINDSISLGTGEYTPELDSTISLITNFYNDYQALLENIEIENEELATIDVNILSYDNNKNLVTIPTTNGTVHPLKTNIKNYLSNYRLITDVINIDDGKIINFGVAFEVITNRSVNKADVKLRCINKIINYFNIDKMQFKQVIYTSDLEYELMGLDGVRAVNYVELTQDFNNLSNGRTLDIQDFTALWAYSSENLDGTGPTSGYGWQYDLRQFYEPLGEFYVGNGIVLPTMDPSVFELKRPKENVRGLVK